MTKFIIPTFIVVIMFFLTTFEETKYNYTIYQGEEFYLTNEIAKDSENCIRFKEKLDTRLHIICGSYQIIEN